MTYVGDIKYSVDIYGDAYTGTGASSGPNAIAKNYSNIIDILPFVTLENKRRRVTEVGQYSFYGCTNATGVKIPTTVIAIRKYAFSSLVLDEIILPGSIVQIDTLGIDNCQNTKLIIFCGKKSAEMSKDISPPLSVYYTVPVQVPLDYIGTTFCKKEAQKTDLRNKCKFINYNANVLCSARRCRSCSISSIFAYSIIGLC